MKGFLEVGLTEDEMEVVINHPDLQPDAKGCGHIVFSPEEARALARLLLKKADACKGEVIKHEIVTEEYERWN